VGTPGLREGASGGSGRDVVWFGKYPSGPGFEDSEHWFRWNFRISRLFFG
jgi:hypothetical protein